MVSNKTKGIVQPSFLSDPISVFGYLFIVSTSGQVYLVNGYTLNGCDQVTLELPIKENESVFLKPLLILTRKENSNNIISHECYVCIASEYHLFLLDISSSNSENSSLSLSITKKWVVESSEEFSTAPTYADDKIVIGTKCGISAYDLQGENLWSYRVMCKSASEMVSTPILNIDNAILFGSSDENDGYIYVINTFGQPVYTMPPLDAIREAIINAICHRDYQISSNVQVRIFDDRIEIWGCGSLPSPLTIDALKRKHVSILRNRLIGKCFFLIKFIEQWGTGTNDIISMCLEYGLPEPIFEEISGSLVVTIRKDRYTEESLTRLNLNKRQLEAIRYVKNNKKITRQEYASLNKCALRTAFNDLQEMVSKQVLQKKEKGKYTYYELI